jgi:hypothetical protein
MTQYVPSDKDGHETHLSVALLMNFSLLKFVGLAMLFTDLLGAPKAITFRSIDCFTGFLSLLLDLSLRQTLRAAFTSAPVVISD